MGRLLLSMASGRHLRCASWGSPTVASQESHSGEVFLRMSASNGEDVLRSACISLVLEKEWIHTAW